jgi:putative ABC transport system ATP-binding protein
MLKLDKISKKFNAGTPQEKVVFQDFSFYIEKGEFISIIGSNGAGKSTFLNLISGTLELDSGDVILEGKSLKNLPKYKRSAYISKVFQNPTLGTAPSMTIMENLSMAENKGKKFGLKLGLNKKSESKYKDLLKDLNLNLENQLYTPVGLLSGGQRQALSLIMATLKKPDLLLLDEHTAALDPKTSKMIMEKTDEIVRKNEVTTLMITHNLSDAIKYGDRLIMFHKGQVILDVTGEEKQSLSVEKLLKIFSQKDNLEFKDTELFG